MVQKKLWLYFGSWIALATLLILVLPPNARAAGTWYVSTGGNDAADCVSPATACLTVNSVLDKSAFTPGDTVKLASGTYTGSAAQVVLLNKNVTLSGGWDSTFATASALSTLDGQDTRRGLQVTSATTATLTRIQIIHGFPGDSTQGGGILNEGTLTLNDSAIENNRTHGGGAAGIQNAGTMTINRTAIRANTAQDYGYLVSGGGISNFGTLTLNSSAVTENNAGFGAGISQGGSGTLTLNNTTVSRNNGPDGINAAGIVSYGGATQLNNVTITENSGNAGLGVAGGSVKLRNTILAGNDANGSGADCGGAIPTGAIVSQGYNLIGAACNFPLTTGDQSITDPKLSFFISHDGGPGYYALLPDSPARNAGNPAGCAGSSGPLTTDQRNVPRTGICDIGAYEYTVPGAPVAIQVISGSAQRSPVTFWNPLQVIVLDGVGSPVNNASVTYTAPTNGASGTFTDSHTNTTTAHSNSGGIAQPAALQANPTAGNYIVHATVSGVGSPADFQLGNFGWYVSSSGSDSNDCQSTAHPCRSIQGALNHAGFQTNDTVLVKADTFSGSGSAVVSINRSARLLGGWNSAFTAQSGMTTLDGQNTRQGVIVSANTAAALDYFTVTNGLAPCCVGTGGGIDNRGTLTLSHSLIQHNSTANNRGGGIHTAGMLNVTDSEISNNTAPGSDGGGIASTGGVVTVVRSVIKNNADGAIENSGVSLMLDQSTVSGNTDVGGILNNGSTLITRSAIINNVAASGSAGGGIANNGNLEISNSTLSGNQAGSGGGIQNLTGTVKLDSVTISGNSASGTGGGLRSAGGSVTLRNTIIAGNTASANPDCEGTLTSSGYNFIGQATCTFTAAIGDIVNAKAFLDAVADNDGPTQTVALRSASPAVDHGDAANCSAQDQRGNSRPQGARCDIGAFELNATPAADLTLTNTDSPDPVAFKAPVSYSLTLRNNGPQAANQVQIETSIPVATKFKSITFPQGWSCTAPQAGQTGSVLCSTAALNPGASAEFILTVNVNGSKKKRADLTNTFYFSAKEYDPHPDSFSAIQTTCVGIPVKPVLVFPPPNGMVSSHQVPLDWQDAGCAASYKLLVRRTSITGPYVVNKKNLAASTFTTKALKPDTYYWQVAACNAFACPVSAWRKFVIK